MYFTSEERHAIVKMANAMINADGKADPKEVLYSIAALKKFGVSFEDIKDSDNLNPVKAVNIISKMSYEQKKVVTAFLGTIMVVDEDINESEHRYWAFVSECCNLPTMNIGEAVEIMNNI